MASSFQKYTQGIQPVTGMAEAGANIGKMYQQGIGAFGASISEGIKAYNDNSAKSEMANAKIQSLGQAYAEKIAMYSKDPEIAQSGILDGMMATAKSLSEAPTKGFAQRAQIAMDAEAKLNGFGNQLQEWSFLRGREMERVAQQGLDKFKGFKSVTEPRFAGDSEFQIDLNLTPQEAQAQALKKLNVIRKSNPNLEGTDEEFLASWRVAREQALAHAKDIHPAVVSAGLEALQAERNNAKAQAEAQNKADLSGVLAAKFWSKDAPAPVVGGALNLPKFAEKQEDKPMFLAPVGKTVASLKDYEKTVVSPVEQYNRKNTPTSTNEELKQISANAEENTKRLEARRVELEAKLAEEKKLSFFKQSSPIDTTVGKTVDISSSWFTDKIQDFLKVNKKTGGVEVDYSGLGKDLFAKALPSLGIPFKVADSIAGKSASPYEKEIIKSGIAGTSAEIAGSLGDTQRELEAVNKQLGAQKSIATGVKTAVAPKTIASVPKVPLSMFQIGTEERQQRLSIADRQREVADFVTSRMGAIDPTDPERKRRLPVSGFDKFYKSLVPEAELREFTTDSGARMLYANGKWEQLKTSDPVTMQDLRKASVGIYGQQDASGRLIPTEFTEGSGVYIGGMFKGTDSANDKYSEEIGNLIDARRGLKKLTEINDRTGEFFSPSAQGEAEVEIMNLSAMLRTDIIGVGTVSNYEQELIKKVIRNPTDFFNLESKDRAILLALAQRVDRRIKSVSASKGLTVIMKDDTGSNKYQALREQYLREKGIL